MKNRIYIGLILGFIALPFIFSCESMMGNYLDKAPGTDVNEDTIFSSKTEVEYFLATIYRYGIHSNLGYGGDNISNANSSLHAGQCDEAEQCAAWYDSQKYNTASVGAHDTGDRRFSYRWQALRKISVMLDRIYDVPDMEKSYADQLVAECKVIRALNYFEMLKHYGGVPIIDRRLNLDDDLNIPRSTMREVVDFILQDIEEALPDLPLHQLGNMRGRVHQGVAYAIRAKTLLYIASPLYNTATPYMNLGEHNDLICMGDYDAGRWGDAAYASLEVLEWAEQAGCRLISDQGVEENYRYSWEVYDNDEIILAEKAHGSRGKWEWPWSPIAPPNIYPGNSGQSGITPTFNFVKKYEKRDGTPQTWESAGGNDLQAKMAELDWRFHGTIAYNMSYRNSEWPTVEIYQGGRHENTCYGGFWLHKHYPAALNDATTWAYVPNSTIFQLNEFYLHYAEAMNEAYGPDSDNGYGLTSREAVNIIRERSGMPPITENYSKDGFRERIWNERAVELAFDNHRYWDIMRWMIAEEEGVMQGGMWGIKIYEIEGSNEF